MTGFCARAIFALLVTQRIQQTVSLGTEVKQFLAGETRIAGPEINEETLFKEQESKSDAEKAKELQQGVEEEQAAVDQWFTWPFWRLITMCALSLLVFTEIVFPVSFCTIGKNLLVATTIFLAEMLSFLITGCAYANSEAAGATHALVLAAVMCAIALLFFLGAVGLKFQKLTKAQELVCNDLSSIFRPISYVVIVFLVVHGLLEETSSDWGNLTVMASMLGLAVAFAMSGVVNDVSYLLIRVNEYFQEGDFIYFDGELFQIKHVYWCYTFAYRPKTRSDMFIPNSAIAGGAVNNQSHDNGRVFEHDVGLPDGLSTEGKQAFIKNAWDLLAKLETNGFTGLNGQKYDCQVDIKKSSIYLDSPGNLHFKLAGLYYFSNPPQWKMDAPEPEKEKRQMEWAAPWNYQVEWFILEMKKISAKASK
jgi:hypothetical protein